MKKTLLKNPLLWVLVLALCLRLFVVSFEIGFDKDLTFFDARDYDRHALNLLTGEGFTNGRAWASRPPLFPILMAALYALFGLSYLPIRIFQSILNTLTILLVYQIGKRTLEPKALWTGIFLCAIHPILILYCGEILTETTACFFLAFLCWTLMKADEAPQKRLSMFFLAGVLFGLLLLTKASLVFFFPFLIGWLLFRKQAGRRVTVFCLALGLTMTPWAIRNDRILGAFVPLTTNGGTSYWATNNPKTVFIPENQGLAADWIMPGRVTVEQEGKTVLLGEVEGDRTLWKKGFQFVGSLFVERPKLFAWILFKKCLAAFSLHAGKKKWELFGYGSLYSMAFLGICLSLRKRPRPGLLYLIVLQYIASVLVFWGRGKFRVVIEPYLMLFVGVFCAWILERLKGRLH